MPKCDCCNTFILFGGVKDGAARFCNENCQISAHIAVETLNIPDEVINSAVHEIHQGGCPICGGRGPVDIHYSHRVWSAFIISSFSKPAQLSCAPCGTKAKIGSLFFCLFLGWWGIPFGIIMTPINICKNFFGMFFGGPKPMEPSADLFEMVRAEAAFEGQDDNSLPSPNR